MRGLESNHFMSSTLEVVIRTPSLGDADWSVPTLVQVAGPHGSQANCLIRFSASEILA